MTASIEIYYWTTVKRALAQAKSIHRGAGPARSGRDADDARKVLFGQRARWRTTGIFNVTDPSRYCVKVSSRAS